MAKTKKPINIKMVALIVIILLFLNSGKNQLGTDDGGTSGGGTVTFTGTGGGGGGGGVPPSGDPDEPCENCDLFWVENRLSSSRPGFDTDGYLTKEGELEDTSGKNVEGHWECRGECPDKNGYPQTCVPKPLKIDPADFNNLPRTKQDLNALMACYCVLKNPCHMEYTNIFCERGIPEDILDSILSSKIAGKYMDIEYSKIREHCKLARCTGGCTGSGEECIKVINKDNTGSPVVSCKCQSDDCRKDYNFQIRATEALQNTNHGVTIGDTLKLSDFIDTQRVQLASQLNNLAYQCTGSCIDASESCIKLGGDCACGIPPEDTGSQPTNNMPVPQPCNAVQVSGDSEWYKCLGGYCDNVPYCYPVGVHTPGWYLGRTLKKADNDCGGCVAYCGAIGTRSQGWFDSCDDSLILYDNTCNSKSTCFYNTYSNSCECTPYTADCAWHVDWNSFSGQMRNGNHPNRYCDGRCYEINYVTECKQTNSPDGEICDCVPTDYGTDGTQDNDMDNDGIPDNEDACPTVFGYRLYSGCLQSVVTSTKLSTDLTTATFLR